MKYFLAAAILLITFQAKAQYTEWLNSDRPGAAMNPYSVGKNVLQVETGYSFTRLKYSYGLSFTNGIYSPKSIKQKSHLENVKIRLGIAEQIEVNAALNYQIDHKEYSPDNSTSTDHYIERAEIGLRGCLLKAKGYTPAIGLELRMLIPYPEDHSGLFFSSTLAIQESFSDYFSLTANVIYTQSQSLGFALNAGLKISDPFGVFIEIAPNYYLNTNGDSGIQTVSNYFNFGGSWSVTRDFQLDLGASLLTNGDNYFQNPEKEVEEFYSIQAGLTWRLDWRH